MTPEPPTIQIFEEIGPDHWELCGDDVTIFERKQDVNFVVHISKYTKEQPIISKHEFQEEFWPVLEMDINGSFHCEYGYSNSNSRVFPAVSWSCFKVKEVKSAEDYHWKQPAIHVNWNADTGRHIVHVLESPLKPDLFRHKIPPALERATNPFSWHATFARMILEQYDGAFWLLRDLVREQEKARSNSAHNPNNFPLLHDILRHLFHYQETVDVAQHTLRMLAQEQDRWREEDPENIRKDIQTWLKTRQRILHEEKRVHSLKTRSKSLNDRHQNEINLAFNLVNQTFGRDQRTDSNMMKTVAVVSMVYLPGTFVSGLYGTNFFSFQADPGNTWLMADEFWMYWAVTLPLTFATMIVWAIWHWWDKLGISWRKKGSGKTTNKPAGITPSKDGVELRPQPGNPLVRRITTAFRLGEVQRTETV
ncbi:hypothetical protein BDW74DRAFT_177842 [Aspergillus multicolor]|uniref:uncharacterized protein n=1 Tax=Aspergillus multicolor TaxID=41759 RepID=UPI003CCDE522